MLLGDTALHNSGALCRVKYRLSTGAAEMVHQVKELATKLKDLGSIPRTDMVEGPTPTGCP